MTAKNVFNEQCITYSQMNLIFNARIFFRRFTTWVRAYMISRYVGIGSAEELFGRLYLETSNFGDMLYLIFGLDKANKFTQRMNQFTFGLRNLIDAQFAGKTEEAKNQINLLYKNADDAAAFLASISPYFDEEEWKDMLRTYLQYTLEQINLFASGDYKNEIALYGKLTDLTRQMGYVFAQGINDYMASSSRSMPPQGGEQCFTMEQVNELYNIRTIWTDLNTWTRNFMISKYKGVGDVNEVFHRLQQVPVDYIIALKQFFGDNPAFDTYQQQLNAYIGLIDSLTTAQMEGRTDEVSRIVQLLYQNADERAASFASLYPSYFSQEELKTRLYSIIRNTINESTTFLTGDYAGNLDIYSTLLNQAESIGGYISDGLADYLKSQRKKVQAWVFNSISYLFQ